ncbi:FAD/NAD(P)-binding protein [Nonlabens sp. Hel1_33_55]|uniref:FAD/NAD(P)-binding protein n=1 Tax=Nonlabens sp. Hel1_33_55 TaxID=1336802 RepID=UPI0012FD39C5|nr:FAD/NAD(P)-binding protein [Nonlabens sp. Hel1_33_55]
MKSNPFLSLIGLGPRGLFALEQLYISFSRSELKVLPFILIFESSDVLGTGTAWKVDQTPSNLSNITDRALKDFPARPAFDLQGTTFPEFPCYFEWLETVMDHEPNYTKDAFQPRRVMGTYLSQRANSFIERLITLEVIELVRSKVDNIEKLNGKFQVFTEDDGLFESTNVLIAIGHVSTAMSDENQKFKKHAVDNDLYFSNNSYSNQAKEIYGAASTFAIKGLGLSMVDVMRMIMDHYDGDFVQQEDSIYLDYTLKGADVLMVPYSLDGLPIVPKPLGKNVDDHFSLDQKQKKDLFAKLHKQLGNTDNLTIKELLKPIATVIADIYSSLEDRFDDTSIGKSGLVSLIVDWLVDPTIKHDHILDANLPVVEYMKRTCEMAYGIHAFSLDYTIGQVWRQLQPDLYNIYSHKLPPKLMSELIQVDEGTKRYSFGPPVESILQIIALYEAGIMNLDFVNDPDLKLIPNGFQLKNKNGSITCEALIDAILSSPNLEEMASPLIRNLKENDLVEQVEDKLGIHVDINNTHLVDGKPIDGLHSIGRNIKGSEYGVDAILESFNPIKIEHFVTKIHSKLIADSKVN